MKLVVLCFICFVVVFSQAWQLGLPKLKFAKYSNKSTSLYNSKGSSILDLSCSQFAEKLQQNAIKPTLKESLEFIDKNFSYLEVPFQNGDIENPANKNTGSAKIFSFAYLHKLSQQATLELFGEVFRNLDPNGNDHGNIRNFIKYGWSGIQFPQGIAIKSKV